MRDAVHLSFVTVLALLVFTPALALVQRSPEQRGEVLVIRHCAICHGIGRSTSSPNPNARPFRTLSATLNLESLEEPLSKGALFGHPMMPSFALTASEARAIVRYLQSIQDR